MRFFSLVKLSKESVDTLSIFEHEEKENRETSSNHYAEIFCSRPTETKLWQRVVALQGCMGAVSPLPQIIPNALKLAQTNFMEFVIVPCMRKILLSDLVCAELSWVPGKNIAPGKGVCFSKNFIRGCAYRAGLQTFDFRYYLFCRQTTHQHTNFLYKKHPILLKLGAFYANLLKIHPIYLNWAPWSVMKTRYTLRSLGYTKFREKSTSKHAGSCQCGNPYPTGVECQYAGHGPSCLFWATLLMT